jgi:hypothetical protein
MGVHHIDCAWDHRRSAQGGNVRRSIAVLIPQHGEERCTERPKRDPGGVKETATALSEPRQPLTEQPLAGV